MLGWLDRFWNNVTGSVGNAIANAVHWAMHALASVVFAVFRLVGAAWLDYWSAARSAWGAVGSLGKALWDAWAYLLRHLIPTLTRWIESLWARLVSFIHTVYKDLQAAAAFLQHLIASTARAIYKWALTSIWKPLHDFAAMLWDNLKKWGFTAWWWITHLPSLAEAMIMHIVTSIERHAWEIAGMLGKFFLSLIVRNLKRFATLLEDIITAVL